MRCVRASCWGLLLVVACQPPTKAPQAPRGGASTITPSAVPSSAPVVSPWLVRACDSPTNVTLTTVASGRNLSWNATGTALAVGDEVILPFRLRSGAGYDNSITLVDVRTQSAVRPRFRGRATPLAGSDAFLVSGSESAVVKPDGSWVRPSQEVPPAPSSIPSLLRPVRSRQADAAIGLDEKSRARRVVVWRAGRALEPLSLQGDETPSSWAISDDAARAALAAGNRIWRFDLTHRSPPRVLSTDAAVRALSFRPGGLELAFTTEKGVALWGEGDAAQHLADNIAEPSTWSIEASPANDAIAAHVGAEILEFSLIDGASLPNRASPQPSTGVYDGLSWRRDGTPAPRNAHDPVLSEDGRFEASFSSDVDLKRRGTTESLRLEVPRVDEESSPALRGVAFSADSSRLLGYADLRRPRNSDHRVVEWSTTDGAARWSTLLDFVSGAQPTRDGWLIDVGSGFERYEAGKSVFSGRGARSYSAATDLLAVIDEQVLVLVDAAGKKRKLPLNFSEPVTGLAFDAAGRRLAIGTTEGLRVVDVPRGIELSSLKLDARVEPLRWRGDLLLALRLSPTSSPEQAVLLLDTRSSAWLSVGHAAVNGSAAQRYVLASNGLVDGSPELLAALHGGERGSLPVPATCARPGLLGAWLKDMSR